MYSKTKNKADSQGDRITWLWAEKPMCSWGHQWHHKGFSHYEYYNTVTKRWYIKCKQAFVLLTEKHCSCAFCTKCGLQPQTSTGKTRTASEHIQIHWLYTIIDLPPGCCGHRRGQPSCCCHTSQTLFAGRWGGVGEAAVVFRPAVNQCDTGKTVLLLQPTRDERSLKSFIERGSLDSNSTRKPVTVEVNDKRHCCMILEI